MGMKPYLLVSTRPEEEALVSEYQAYLLASGLPQERLELAEFDLLGLPPVNLAEYQGVFVAGSPYGNTALSGGVSKTQAWVAEELRDFFDQVVEAGVPCLATGTAMTILAKVLGGTVSSDHGELSEITQITLTREGREDPILAGVEEDFLAYTSHTESCEDVPGDGVRLAWSLNCPIQMFRIGENMYATQFSPELDAEAMQAKIEAYTDAGDFGVGDLDMLVATGRHQTGSQQAALVLKNFVKVFG